MVCQKGTPLPVVRIGLLIGAGLEVMVCQKGTPLLVVRAVLPFLRHTIATFGWPSYGFLCAPVGAGSVGWVCLHPLSLWLVSASSF